MEVSRQIIESVDSSKSLALELNNDNRLNLLKEDLSSVAGKAIDKAANYVIKAMPVPDAIKDILQDVKEAIKTKDLKKVITTAVKSSVREGLEILGISTSSINDIIDLKNVATKGGLITALKNSIEIVATNYLRGNIVGEHVYKFFDKLKEYILSNRFLEKFNGFLDKLAERKQEFLSKCESWYKSYKLMDINELNNIAEKLDENKYILNRYEECKRENKIIQNMTNMLNNKKENLGIAQQRLCEVL